MAATLTLLATPVVSDRFWATALWQDPAGDWYFIAQFYNLPNANPSEWVVINLRTGTYTIDMDNPYSAGARGMYCSGTRYLIANQKRAANDKIFFPAIDGWLWYFDPADKRIHDFGPVTSTTPYDDSLFVINFDTTGNTILWGTIAAAQAGNGNDHRPRFGTFDTTTLTSHDYGRIGSSSRTLNGYCYRTHCDAAGSVHAYAIVGQQFWELVDINLSTGAKTTLATTAAGGNILFVEKPEGLVAQVYENYNTPSQTLTEYWVVDGVLYAYSAGYDPATLPFVARSVAQYNNDGAGLTNPPSIDTMTFPASVGWRPFGSSADYTRVPFTLNYVSPITLESLHVLDDGTLLGSAQQYQGFFRYHPSTTQLEYYGAWNGVGEGEARTLVTGTIIGISGYPNGVYFEFDRTLAWTQTSRFGALNPSYKGAYSNGDTFSGVKRAEELVYDATNNRMYMVGLRDRSGFGMGVGYYDRTSHAFAGTFTNNDLYMDDCGLAVFHALNKVVIGGKISTGDAQLITYDLGLAEQRRDTPIVGNNDTGRLYRSSESNIVIGVASYSKKAYRWNVQTNTLVSQVDLTSYGTVGTITQDATDTILIVLGTTLYRMNLLTLGLTSLGDMGVRPAYVTMSGGNYYGIYGTGLYQITPDGVTPPASPSGGSGGSGGTSSGGGSMSADVPLSSLTQQQLMELANYKRSFADALDATFGDLEQGVADLQSEITPSDVAVSNGNAADIVIGQPVYLTANGIVDLAKADSITTSGVLGIVSSVDLAPAQLGTARITDYLDATAEQWDLVCGTSGGLTGGVTYYLSATTAGKLTSTAPSTDGQCVVPVIQAITATRAKIVIRPAVQL